MKLCKDCKWVKPKDATIWVGPYPYKATDWKSSACGHPKHLHPVDGDAWRPCEAIRAGNLMAANGCGPEGNLWEPR